MKTSFRIFLVLCSFGLIPYFGMAQNIDKLGCLDGDCINGEGIYNYANGDIYSGKMVDEKPEGQGIMFFENGLIYDGAWKKGLYHGIGTFYDEDGKLMNCSIWKKGSLHDSNRDSPPSPDRINELKAILTKIKSDFGGSNAGVSKTGCISGNCENGTGTYKFDNGDQYQGEWKDGQMHGKGKYTWENGNYYEGDWVAHARTGKGVFAYFWGGKFEGEWLNGAMHGKGKYIKEDGTIENEGYYWKGEYFGTEWYVKEIEEEVLFAQLIAGFDNHFEGLYLGANKYDTINQEAKDFIEQMGGFKTWDTKNHFSQFKYGELKFHHDTWTISFDHDKYTWETDFNDLKTFIQTNIPDGWSEISQTESEEYKNVTQYYGVKKGNAVISLEYHGKDIFKHLSLKFIINP